MKLFGSLLHTGSRIGADPIEDSAPIVRGRPDMEDKELEKLIAEDPEFSLVVSRKDMLVHEVMRVVKCAMTKVSAREQMWCDIISKAEKDIRRVIDETTKK